MKRKSLYRITTILGLALFFAACTKEMSEVRLDSKVATTQTQNVTSNSATVTGFIVAEGAGLSEKGVCYNTATGPTISNSKASYSGTSKSATFTVNLSGLNYATKYYVRAYATTSESGTIYGEEYSFTTLPIQATLTTSSTTNITPFTATSGGNITANGGAEVTARGVCYSTKPSPTIADSKTTNGKGNGAFVSELTGLKNGTTYYVRAYATNSAGTAYGNEVSFKTADFPTAIYALGDGTTAGWDNSAAIKINQTADPGVYEAVLDLSADKSLKFIQNLGAWQPQWGQAKGQSKGILGANLGGGDDPDAIATPSSAGKYKVSVDLGKMTYSVVAAYPSALYMIGDGVGDWSWDNTDLPMIPVNSHPNMFWKIVWMKGSGSYKFFPQKGWDNGIGQPVKDLATASNQYDFGVENIPVPSNSGYYMVVVDYLTKKISVSTPTVYLIGNTIGSWDTSNPAGLFTVDNTNGVVNISKTLAADEVRMYAWHPWFTDWWQSEFIILNGKIAFRGTGGDQTRVSVTAGSHTVSLNFKTGDGSIQ